MNGISIKVKDKLGNEVEGQPVGLQLLEAEQRMTVKIPGQDELVAIPVPEGWVFNPEQGWKPDWL